LAKLLRNLNADVVHGYLFDAEIAVRLAGRWAETKVIGGSERNTDYDFKYIHLLTYRLTRGMVDFYIANSHAGARFNANALHNPEEMYFTVHNGIDTDRFIPGSRHAARDKLNLPQDKFIVGMFGSLKQQKNHSMLLDAFIQLRQDFPHSHLLIVGDQLAGGMHGSDEYAAGVIRKVDELDLAAHSTFIGNQENVESVYPACDVTALPSLFEGTPNVALESMACAVPVVATNVSDNARIITDSTNGFIVPLNDTAMMARRLSEIAESESLRDKLGKAARETMLAEYSCARLAEKTQNVYLDVLGVDIGAAHDLRSFIQPED
jgi:glycosyltransferase involved in cell wall biosynthesis